MITVDSTESQCKSRASGAKLAVTKAVDSILEQLLTVKDCSKIAVFSSYELFDRKIYRYYDLSVQLKANDSIMKLVSNNKSNIKFDTAECNKLNQTHAMFSVLEFHNLNANEIEFAKAKSISE